jgi:hypothetical protein
MNSLLASSKKKEHRLRPSIPAAKLNARSPDRPVATATIAAAARTRTSGFHPDSMPSVQKTTRTIRIGVEAVTPFRVHSCHSGLRVPQAGRALRSTASGSSSSCWTECSARWATRSAAICRSNSPILARTVAATALVSSGLNIGTRGSLPSSSGLLLRRRLSLPPSRVMRRRRGISSLSPAPCPGMPYPLRTGHIPTPLAADSIGDILQFLSRAFLRGPPSSWRAAPP